MGDLARAGNPWGLPAASRPEVAAILAGAEEGCCGDIAHRLGEEGRFQELALANIDALERRGVKRATTQCAHCHNTLANEYPALGARFTTIDHATVLRDLLAAGRIVPQVPSGEPVALHDACFAGRHNGILDAPRAVLGARLVELGRRRERSACCGGGGGGYWFDVARAERPGISRVREVLAAGTRRVATECPFCLKMLESAASAAGEPLDVRDLVEWVAPALAPPTGAPFPC